MEKTIVWLPNGAFLDGKNLGKAYLATIQTPTLFLNTQFK